MVTEEGPELVGGEGGGVYLGRSAKVSGKMGHLTCDFRDKDLPGRGNSMRIGVEA